MIMVYVASPYTLGDTGENVRAQLETGDKLMDMGYCPILPLLTHFQHIHKPRPYCDWMAIDVEKIRRCDVLLRLPGQSKGADDEVECATKLKIPVVYSITELTNTTKGWKK